MKVSIFNKFIISTLCLLIMIFSFSTKVIASDSTSTDGMGYVVRGSISDVYLSGSVGGKLSNTYPSVTLVGDVYIAGTSGTRVRVKNSTSTTYNTYSINTITTDINGRRISPVKWYRGYVSAKITGVGVVETRWMYN